jgi:DNA-directed RNA polymerase subunit RPC12/RpoP
MITSRFNKDEAVVQRDYMTTNLRKRRIYLLVGTFFAMLIMFIVLVIAATPYNNDPLFIPLFPSVLAFFISGAVFLTIGMYFKKRFWTLADPAERKPMAARYARMAMVWIIIFVIVLVLFLPMSPMVPKPNYAEGMMTKERQATVGPSTHIRLEFPGADIFATVQSGVSIKCTNDLTLDFYMMTKDTADQLDAELNQIADLATASRINSTDFEYRTLDLDSQVYTVVMVNTNNETAHIEYTIHETTSDGLTTLFVIFFMVYIAMAGAWMQYSRTLGLRVEAPAALPPAPLPMASQVERPTVQRAPMAGPAQAHLGGPAPLESYPAEAEQPSSGTRMTISCPRCSTTFDVVRGAGPTRIKCPSCGKEGTLAGLPMPPKEPEPAPTPPTPRPAAEASYMPRVERPAPQAPPVPAYEEPAPPEPTYPEAPVAPQYPAAPAQAEIPEAPTLPAAPVIPVTPVPKRNIACPRCRRIFAIDKVEGPQHIRCPHCGKEGTIGAAKAPAISTAPPAILEVPVTIVLASPGAAVARSQAAPSYPAAHAVPSAPGVLPPFPGTRPATPVSRLPSPGALPPSPPKMISCPACKKPFPVAETRRPLQVKCPNCGKEGMLRK